MTESSTVAQLCTFTLENSSEHYHDKVGHGPTEHNGEGIASAHDIVRFKHPVTPDDIVPDTLPRALALDTLDGQALTDYRQPSPDILRFERADIVKTWAVNGATAIVTWQLSGLAGRRFSTRLNLAMPSCDGFLGRYVLADGTVPGGFGRALELAEADVLTLEDGVLGGSIKLLTSRAATIGGQPHQTVSQSEAGFEKIMQAVELRLAWTIPEDHCTLQLQLITEPSPT